MWALCVLKLDSVDGNGNRRLCAEVSGCSSSSWVVRAVDGGVGNASGNDRAVRDVDGRRKDWDRSAPWAAVGLGLTLSRAARAKGCTEDKVGVWASSGSQSGSTHSANAPPIFPPIFPFTVLSYNLHAALPTILIGVINPLLIGVAKPLLVTGIIETTHPMYEGSSVGPRASRECVKSPLKLSFRGLVRLPRIRND